MNETIAMPHLAKIISEALSIDSVEAEKFIKLFFEHIEDSLAVEESVTIDMLGCFMRTGDNQNPVKFIPDPRLVGIVNEPFEMFTPVAIGETVFEEDDSDNTDEAESESETQESECIAIQSESIEPEEAEEEVTIEPACADDKSDDSEEISVYDQDNQPLEVPETHNRSFRGLYMLLIGIVAGFIIGYLCHDILKPVTATAEDEPTTAVVDVQEDDTVSCSEDSPVMIDDIEANIEDEDNIEPEYIAVYDTVTPTRFLTTMARKYYGPVEFWAFIYEANSDHLGNPNRIKPGTVVIIPDQSQFLKDEPYEQTLERARQMGREIYSRFE